MTRFDPFEKSPVIIGMIHLDPLPGSPGFDGNLESVLEHAIQDALAIKAGNLDGLMIENFNDTPFFKDDLPPEAVAGLTRCALAVRSAVPDLPLGVNALRNDGLAALGIAHAVGASFIRVNVLTGAMVTDQGIIEGCAAELLRRRAALRAPIAIFADVGVKHASALGNVLLADAARDTVHRGHADALIVSGAATGQVTSAEDLAKVRAATPAVPVYVGSGVNAENIDADTADGFIVGTALKRDGRVDVDRVQAIKNALN
jgi:membrane complex biogenesis BtpA family protein